MTQFKVGDRVKLVGEEGAWCPDNVGKEGVVISLPHTQYEWVRVKFDNSEDEVFETDYGNASCLEIVTATTPPETIQHGGYNYTRGEPVVPEWVKDEAWIVDKEDGAVSQLFICGNSVGVHGYTETDYGSIDLCDVADVFRPFTNEDWKWGMWAEYKGEKVFVSERIDNGVTVSKPSNPYFFIPFSELTPTTAP